MRTHEQITSEHKHTREFQRQEPAREAPPRILVNGESLKLTLDTELKRVEHPDRGKTR